MPNEAANSSSWRRRATGFTWKPCSAPPARRMRLSSRTKESYLREGMNEEWMKLVIKKFPGSRWADLAAFSLLDNKMCGDWQGSSKCPDKEAEIYEKYATDRPNSPLSAQALYDAA